MPDLSNELLMGITSSISGPLLKGQRTDLSGVNFSRARLRGSFLESVDLDHADLSSADLTDANLKRADLHDANLSHAILKDANLRSVNLSGANMANANLMRASFVETNLEGAVLTGCNIYGVFVWGVQVDDKTEQSNLLIANYNEATIRVPSLEIAQFIYLLLDHKKLRDVIKTIGERTVLIYD